MKMEIMEETEFTIPDGILQLEVDKLELALPDVIEILEGEMKTESSYYEKFKTMIYLDEAASLKQLPSN